MVLKKQLGLFILFILVAGTIQAQQIIENPDKPLSKNAGRVVVPAQVLAITDEGASDYYFKWPHNLRVAPEGPIFVADIDQLLCFDKSGRFIRNFQKKGQGPGEVEGLVDYALTVKDIILLSQDPYRLLWFDQSGKFAHELPLRVQNGYIQAIPLVLNGVFYFHTWESFHFQGEARFFDLNHRIEAAVEGKEELTPRAAFPINTYAAAVGGSSGWFDQSSLFAVPYHGKFLVLSHTAEYLLKIYDVEANLVVREFKRAYHRVEQPPVPEGKRGMLMLNGKKFLAPVQKYKNDIADELVHRDDIWVVTSTRDKDKGVLVDVFNEKGAYTDCFYLKLPELALKNIGVPGSCTIRGDFLYVIETNEDGISAIKKYKMGI